MMMKNWCRIGVSVRKCHVLRILLQKASLEKSKKGTGYGMFSLVTWISKRNFFCEIVLNHNAI